MLARENVAVEGVKLLAAVVVHTAGNSPRHSEQYARLWTQGGTHQDRSQ